MMNVGAAAPGEAVRLRAVGKRFGGTVALSAADLVIETGSIAAFVGENGAGKSTCLGVLAGRVMPTTGEVEIFGRPLPLGNPRAARRAGVAAIYQELTIVPALSTQANVFLGQDLAQGGFLRERAMRAGLEQLCTRIGVQIPVDVLAGRLSVGDQQLVEIMRALVADPRVILLDEPTAALASREREALYKVIRGLSKQGVTVVFVSHNLEEVLDLADVVTVFRNGRITASRTAADWTKASLVRAMVGGELERTVNALHQLAPSTSDREAVRVEQLSVPSKLRSVSFSVDRGEVVGVGGLVGSGRSTLLRALAGDVPDASGRLWLDGTEVRWPVSVRQARRHGIALVPEDRARMGLFMRRSAVDNILISRLRDCSRFGLVSSRRERDAAKEVSQDVRFAPARLGELAGSLSGGNQQKLLLARAAHTRPAVLLADEPTRGVDVGAKAEIMRTIRRLAASDIAVIIVSSELEDLEAVCDRVVVLSRGELVGEIKDPAAEGVQSILRYAFRAEETR
jgi:ribose transport system ATP-binding protein